jgi:hypothetical protein
MPPKKQKLADSQSAPSPTSSSPHTDLHAPPVALTSAASGATSSRTRRAPLSSNSPKTPESPTSPLFKRGRSESAGLKSASASELPSVAAAPADQKGKPVEIAIASSAGADPSAGNALVSGAGGDKKKHFPFIYGNYSGYYGYRSPSAEDSRLKVLHVENETDSSRFITAFSQLLTRSMFEGKRCLDIGCNSGELTVSIARRYAPQHILGVDIDGSLVRFVSHPSSAFALADNWSMVV